MRIASTAAFALALSILAGCAGGDAAEERARKITVWWAQWEPANGLQELSKAWSADSGVEVEVYQIPWPDFQRRAFTEFGRRETPFDILIGDSQWIGSAVAEGMYLELTDWIAGQVDLERIHERAARYLCEYPPGSGRWYAAPCETDSMGFAYRRDWFEDAAEQEAFEARYGYPLAVPATWDQVRDLAEFFQRPDERRHGIVFPTGRAYDGMTMGFQPFLWAFGADWADAAGNPIGTLDTPAAAAALDFHRSLVALGPNGAASSDYGQTVDYFQNGSAAMMMNYFAFFPGVAHKYGERAGFFALPEKDGRRGVSLGGQGMSISTKIPAERQELCKDFIAWFLRPEQQRAWIAHPGCFTADEEILASEAFRQAEPYNAPFADSLADVKDFWNIPEFNDLLTVCQARLIDAVDGRLDSAEALAAIAREHAEILRAAGRLQ